MLIILKDEHCESLMKNIYETLKVIINEKKIYDGIEDRETIFAFFKLITSVLEICNSEVSIMAVQCFKFLGTKLDSNYFKEHCNHFYGSILQTLNYKYLLIAAFVVNQKT